MNILFTYRVWWEYRPYSTFFHNTRIFIWIAVSKLQWIWYTICYLDITFHCSIAYDLVCSLSGWSPYFDWRFLLYKKILFIFPPSIYIFFSHWLNSSSCQFRKKITNNFGVQSLFSDWGRVSGDPDIFHLLADISHLCFCEERERGRWYIKTQ